MLSIIKKPFAKVPTMFYLTREQGHTVYGRRILSENLHQEFHYLVLTKMFALKASNFKR